MMVEEQKRRFSRLGALTVAAVGLAALALPLAPAKAQIGFGCGPFGCGVGIGPFGVGVGSPYYGYGYGYGPYWGHTPYAPYSRPYGYWW
jgi:hypothetical protein